MTSATEGIASSTPADHPRKRYARAFPIGAEVVDEGVHFRVWAPKSRKAAVVLAEDAGMQSPAVHALEPEGNGYFAGLISEARDGQHYRIRLESGEYPDPASRFQPQGPQGPSRIVDPRGFRWSDKGWRGVPREGQVVYEMHVGTFTAEGTWSAAADRLPTLVNLGITVVEVMPVADFPGRFGWGYDGVNLFAPTRLYGDPDDFRRFVDRAHALGLGVILDVVYNHFGPDGNCLREFSDHYFSTRYENEWGDPINFDDEQSGPVREFFIANAAYWISEFHLDGLRLDATQQIFDASEDHILAAIARATRQAGKGRAIYLVAENEPQLPKLVRAPEQGGFDLDALWNDDFHHSAVVALTGQNEAYYTDYRGWPQEFISAAKWGYLFQGQRYRWQKQRRGKPALDIQPCRYVNCIQNHDQVANSGRGRRIHELTSPSALRAMTAVMILSPGTPMLFQGQEFASSAPFLYFADHNPKLARMVAEGRRNFVAQFPSAAALIAAGEFESPEDEQTFLRSKLDWRECEKRRAIFDLHRDLIRLRREDPIFLELRRGMIEGAVLTQHAFLLRYFSEQHGERLLVVNLGGRIAHDPAPEPLLAPPEDQDWELLWSSEDPRYNGNGTPPMRWKEENWILPANSAFWFKSQQSDHANTPRPQN